MATTEKKDTTAAPKKIYIGNFTIDENGEFAAEITGNLNGLTNLFSKAIGMFRGNIDKEMDQIRYGERPVRPFPPIVGNE